MMNQATAANSTSNRHGSAVKFWLDILKTRAFLALAVLLFAFAGPGFENRHLVIFRVLPIYSALMLLLCLVPADLLRLRRFRLLRDALDIVLISILVFQTGGQASPWFLIYLFPIISASRYFGFKGSAFLGIFALFLYLFGVLYRQPPPGLEPFSLGLQILAVGALSFIVGDMAKKRGKEEERFIDSEKAIHEAILSNRGLEHVFTLILNKAIEVTNSERGEIKLVGEDPSKRRAIKVAFVGEPINLRPAESPELSFSDVIMSSQKPRILPNFTETHRQDYLSLRQSGLRSCVIAPLLRRADSLGVLTVGSSKRLHYTSREVRILENFARLVVLALQNDELIKSITQRAEEREREGRERLKVLHSISDQLKATASLKDLFENVVRLTMDRLGSEEAALFLHEAEKPGWIKKEAVSATNPELQATLESGERFYKSGVSYTGTVFKMGEPNLINEIKEDVAFGDFYRRFLPSGKTQHYLGVPLVIGNKVLGVLRVINKRSPSYSLENENYDLSDKGFDRDDLELMQTLATQVAVAVQNANLLEQHRTIQAYYSKLVENSPDPIIAIEKDGTVKVFNKACEALWDCTMEDALGRPVEEFYVSREQARAISKRMWEAEPDYRLQNQEVNVKDAKGQIIPISLSAALLLDDQGQKIGSIGVFKDLRVLKQLQDELIRVKKLEIIRLLAGTVIHDLKHDIGACLFYIDTLLRKEKEARLLKIYGNIKQALLRALEVLQEVLIAGNPEPKQKQLVRLEDILEKDAEQMFRQAKAKGIELSIAYPRDRCELMVDLGLIRRVTWNLFNNSVDAVETKRTSTGSGEPGRIEVSAQLNNGHVEIMWRDNGCGVRDHDLPHIFTEFFTSKATNAGTGLGLYIVKAIIEGHNGKIAVESELGQWTNFSIQLPTSRATDPLREK
jgi:PAS domain S-box-containing protein